MKINYILILLFFFVFELKSQNIKTVYIYNLNTEIVPPAWRQTQKVFEQAKEKKADVIIFKINTYGGLVDAADSIRTRILKSEIPVCAFIENNAASAGALISLACDSIFMTEGAKIGAATVVTPSGQKAPDKYQSYMRAAMRATAEAHGYDTIIKSGDTLIKWRRDPKIAESMVDEKIVIPNIVDSTQILTFTTNEALKYGYCDRKVKNVNTLIKSWGDNIKTLTYQPSLTESIIDFFLNPVIHGFLIMIIIGGIYFELQTPGVGFPLSAAIIASILYFAPLYLDGLAQNWEIIVFFIGVVLLLLEVFVVPGFGITGISGITFIIIGLSMSMINNNIFGYNDVIYIVKQIAYSFGLVIFSILALTISILFFGNSLIDNHILKKFILTTEQNTSKGYIANNINEDIINKTGVSITDLRPAGKIAIDNDVYDAISYFGFIPKNTQVKIIKIKSGQVYVKTID